ncbi:hypothetical protein [Nonomuraea aurantiaca]|uniref:hypothetical protein n=1 Tax=Nonomuraea aurantiaca TaxID=2878562 RepID=UPI001CD929BD|nr:hypothetical protein [Nonomuraea aurantiaca]MCA2223157.1 hypothetical protein [Nonomuraea aurantiaca]
MNMVDWAMIPGAESSGSGAGTSDIAELPSSVAEAAAGDVTEDVLQRGGRAVAEAGAQVVGELLRCAERPYAALVHERDPVAVLVGLVHVVRGDQDGHPGGGAYRR